MINISVSLLAVVPSIASGATGPLAAGGPNIPVSAYLIDACAMPATAFSVGTMVWPLPANMTVTYNEKLRTGSRR
jgi:hypothetical protein